MAMRSDLALRYDKNADVLYVLRGEPVPAETDEDELGLLLRFALSDGHPCGVTILDFHRDNWSKRVRELSNAVASHLHVPAWEISEALSAVM